MDTFLFFVLYIVYFFVIIMTFRARVGIYLALCLIQSFLQVSRSYFWNCSAWLTHVQYSTIFPIVSNDFPDFLALHSVVVMLCWQILLRWFLIFLTL